MLKTVKYKPSEKEQAFLNSVTNGKYYRQIINGLDKFIDKTVPKDVQSFYTEDEIQSLAELKGTARDIESRMPVKVTRHYIEQARKSKAMQKLVKASPGETVELDGEPDPANQMDYSPLEGLIHKYEMGLVYVVSTCSAHCRFCYREELIANKEIVRPNGIIAPKGLAQISEIVAYIREHNRRVSENGGKHPDTGRESLREILLSGGDPMVLGNRSLANWLSALSEAGIATIRIGTKELAFFPDRFNGNFFDMLDKFHNLYPETRLRFMVHFNHPDEFLKKDSHGHYIKKPAGGFEWLDNTRRAVRGLQERNWINIDNQAPIIKDVNNNPDALHIMQRELVLNGVDNHYFFCGRDIIGYKAFNVPIEEAWHSLNESQKGLSGVESHARLVISHYKGKIEVVAVTNEPLNSVPATSNGIVIFKLIRSVGDASELSKITVVKRNPKALWFDGYADRVIYDEIGLYTG